ncbi:hypothetical protein BRADI_4g33765v3 [Brachypodium distachyon]|uniref:Uncharacterized protein n=2 Tax=Brachypodium distachyon TaxID=15368 RepID=A0A0Q3ETB5_BRADI|nr:hypothetical protein BRADI_4g33765v3 [Brachypodium distachyon]
MARFLKDHVGDFVNKEIPRFTIFNRPESVPYHWSIKKDPVWRAKLTDNWSDDDKSAEKEVDQRARDESPPNRPIRTGVRKVPISRAAKITGIFFSSTAVIANVTSLIGNM